MKHEYAFKGLEFTRIFTPANGEPRVEKRTVCNPGDGDFWLYMRYGQIALAASKQDPGRVQVSWDRVSVRVYQYGENGRIVRWSELKPLRDYSNE